MELIDPLASRSDVRAEVTAVHRQTPKSVTLTLAPNENWAGARAGQFVGLTVEIDGRRETAPVFAVGLGAQPRRECSSSPSPPTPTDWCPVTCAITPSRG